MTPSLSRALLLVTVAVSFVVCAPHSFRPGHIVPLFLNTVGPYHNPLEVYPFLTLPFCPMDQRQLKHTTLGERLAGDKPVLAPKLLQMPFAMNLTETRLCTVEVSEVQIAHLRSAIKNFYYYELIYDDLPIHGFVGLQENTEYTTPSEPRYFLFTHMHFTMLFHGSRIIKANVTADRDSMVELKAESGPMSYDIIYSADWYETDVPFNQRMNFYKDPFFAKEMEIHWLSIMNSVVLVALLTGFLAIIVIRILKNDISRYEKGQNRQDGDPEDYGWKLVHHDVFRFPAYKIVLCVFCGLGAQFLTTAFSLLSISLMGVFHPEMGGTIYVAAIVLYALSSGVGGFVATRLYTQMEGKRWSWVILLTATMFAVPVLLISLWVNVVAHAYGSTIALPFFTIVEVLVIHCFVGIPLYLVGGIAGKRTSGSFYAPCRVSDAVRPIPMVPWYRSMPCQMAMSGFLPFSAIYIELFYIFASVWGHSYYSLYGILFVVFVILLVVTACITIALSYFQLSVEDHRWWWHSFLCGGSAGIFLFAYSFFYFQYRSLMSGLLQSSFYFGYMFAMCYCFFIMLGTVGFYSSLVFVRYIYAQLKSE